MFSDSCSAVPLGEMDLTIECEMETTRGNKCVIVDGYKLSQSNTLSDGKVRFRCINRACGVTIVTTPDVKMVIGTNGKQHNHERYPTKSLKREKLKTAIKRKAGEDMDMKPSELIREFTSDGDGIMLSDITAIRKCIYRARQKSITHPFHVFQPVRVMESSSSSSVNGAWESVPGEIVMLNEETNDDPLDYEYEDVVEEKKFTPARISEILPVRPDFPCSGTGDSSKTTQSKNHPYIEVSNGTDAVKNDKEGQYFHELLALEHRKLELEEAKLKFEKEKFELEKKERAVRLQLDRQEQNRRIELVVKQHKIVEGLLKLLESKF